ncbi:DNA polymerase III subunit delta [Halomonas halocynthiae]|uniref:DNA polymerase III subunit delta n=1 Tax=Halomonas halocynthiae TaxID=176290 RepID=UPI0004207F28|nr:DNA polymerase III subunit delta [Halomonas halocynthiae]
MKVYPDKLDGVLARGLPAVVIVAGDEPLQHRDACDAVRLAARQSGIEERQVLDVEANFAWGRLTEAASSLSLFASRKLIELRLGNSKPGQEGGKVLRAYAQQFAANDPANDNLLLINSGKLDFKEQKSAWFKALDSVGVFVPIWPVEANFLPRWLAGRAKLHGLHIDNAAAQLLGERTEGNLLAADQELQKLALLLPAGARVTSEQIAGDVEDNARFDVFTLTDACLKGEPARASRIISGLRSEGVEAPIVLWALSREMRQLLSLHQHLEQGQSLEHAFKAQKPPIFERRRPAYQQALKRLPRNRLYKLLLFSQRLDLSIKGAAPLLPLWEGLHDLALTLAGGHGLLATLPSSYRTGS